MVMIGVKGEVNGCSISDDLIYMNSKEIALLHSLNSNEMCLTLSCPSSQDPALDCEGAVSL